MFVFEKGIRKLIVSPSSIWIVENVPESILTVSTSAGGVEFEISFGGTNESGQLPDIYITNAAKVEDVALLKQAIGAELKIKTGNLPLELLLGALKFQKAIAAASNGAMIDIDIGGVDWKVFDAYISEIGADGGTLFPEISYSAPGVKIEVTPTLVLLSERINDMAKDGIWIILPTNHTAVLRATDLNLKDLILFTPAEIRFEITLPGPVIKTGGIVFVYKWEYDELPGAYLVPFVIINLNIPTIPVPTGGPGWASGGPGWSSGGGGGGRAISFDSSSYSPDEYSYSPPHVIYPERPVVKRVESIPVETVHERVKLSISQEATLERDAFEACLAMKNKLTDKNIEDVRVELKVFDINNSDASDKFFIKQASLSNITDINGTGTINPSTTATVHWTCIPKTGAGGDTPYGEFYFFQAFISYTVSGHSFSINSTSVKINVRPQPLLSLDYYIPAEVKADTEFKLAVKVTNNGYGVAKNFAIDSAQPKIYENIAGLLVDFTITGSAISGKPAGHSLKINFGDIPPGGSKFAWWEMVTSLDGNFTEFSASFTHSNALGGAETSLISGINTHIITREVATGAVTYDFLVDSDNNGIPDEIVDSVHGNSTEVRHVNYTVYMEPTPEHPTLVIETEKYGGWIYIEVDDPYDNDRNISSIVRSDGKVLNPQNYWMLNGKIYIVDDPAERYSINYEAFDINPPVISDVSVKNVTTTSAIITWETDEPSDSLVKYGTEPGNYTFLEHDLTNVTSHRVVLSGLIPDTVYYFVVNSTDESGNSNESIEYNFTTPAAKTIYIPIEKIDEIRCWIGGSKLFSLPVANVGDKTANITQITTNVSWMNWTSPPFSLAPEEEKETWFMIRNASGPVLPALCKVSIDIITDAYPTYTQNITISIYPDNTSAVHMRVVDNATGNALPDSIVLIDDRDIPCYTNSNGEVWIDTTAGGHSFYAYHDGYLPKMIYETLEPGVNEVEIRIDPGEVMLCEVNVTAITYEELREKGIEVENPENYDFYRFFVELSIGAPPAPTPTPPVPLASEDIRLEAVPESGAETNGSYVWVPSGTDPLNSTIIHYSNATTGVSGSYHPIGNAYEGWNATKTGVNEVTITTSTGESYKVNQTSPNEATVTTSTGESYNVSLPSNYTAQALIDSIERGAYAWIHVEGEVHGLKEFFKVEAIVTNKAEPIFILSDVEATIELPGGLSLPTLYGESQTFMHHIDDISGQSTGNTSWVIRGDEEGNYTITVDVSAVLEPFNIPVMASGDADVRVYGMARLQPTFITARNVESGTTFTAYLELYNPTPRPAYEVSVELFNDALENVVINDTPLKYIGTMEPGEKKRVVWNLTAKISGFVTLDASSIYTDADYVLNPRLIFYAEDVLPPSPIMNLQHTTETTWINWTWNNPPEEDFCYTMVYIDGKFRENVSTDYFILTGLSPGEEHEIGTHTVDIEGNVNLCWVNDTARTLLAPAPTPTPTPTPTPKPVPAITPLGFIVALVSLFGLAAVAMREYIKGK